MDGSEIFILTNLRRLRRKSVKVGQHNTDIFNNVEFLMNFKHRILREFQCKLEESLEFIKVNYKGMLTLSKDVPRFDPLGLESYSLFAGRIMHHLPHFKEEDSFSLPPSHRDFSLTKANFDKYSAHEDSNDDSIEEFIDYKIVPVTDFCANAKYNFFYLDENCKKAHRQNRTHNVSGTPLNLDVKFESAVPQMLLDRRVTRIRKYQSSDQDDISLWIVGYGNFIAKLGNNKDLIYTENKAISDSYIVEMSRLGDNMVFFKSTYHLLATDMSLNVIFEADIREWFEPNDKIACCLTYEDHNLLIIGTEKGYLISMAIGFSDRSLFLKGRELLSTKSVKSLFWTYYKNMEFCAAFQEGKLVILRVSPELGLEPIKTFSYNMELSCALTFNRLGALAFRKGIVSIIEFDKGVILYSYQLSSDNDFIDRITWLGFLNYDIYRRSHRGKFEDYSSEQSYCESISRIKFIVRVEDDSLYTFSHSTPKGKYQKITLFNKQNHPVPDLRKQPLEPVFERTGTGCSIRFFKTAIEMTDPLSDDNQHHQSDRFNCMMHEVSVSITDD